MKLKFKKHKLNNFILAAGAVTIIAGSAAVARRVITPGEIVAQVIDGDSFKIKNDQTIRLASLDSPEVKYCFGPEAKDALTKKILGKRVLLQDLKTDRYGRVMAMVYLNGQNINEYMVKNGLALHIWDTSGQNKILDAANNFARENKLGIFSQDCTQVKPPDPECVIKGNVIQHTKAKEYNLPSCNLYSMSIVEKYKGEEWFCTEKEAAKAGFVKSANCK